MVCWLQFYPLSPIIQSGMLACFLWSYSTHFWPQYPYYWGKIIPFGMEIPAFQIWPELVTVWYTTVFRPIQPIVFLVTQYKLWCYEPLYLFTVTKELRCGWSNLNFGVPQADSRTVDGCSEISGSAIVLDAFPFPHLLTSSSQQKPVQA